MAHASPYEWSAFPAQSFLCNHPSRSPMTKPWSPRPGLATTLACLNGSKRSYHSPATQSMFRYSLQLCLVGVRNTLAECELQSTSAHLYILTRRSVLASAPHIGASSWQHICLFECITLAKVTLLPIQGVPAASCVFHSRQWEATVV